ncbi:Saccharopine dehydrogenase-like oxidoreductase [Chionoecetes opilio]|uniref:Saccharopine dehydrogenase-like oxidoreductase n=1 Tax=Chionoecetes opilio TaxID=41210 RepID=A0A8J4YD20_CHIOP|nr:Saccharopine dehydrogenase-like oxidoreductase [Chionoecetes opilio]
MASGVAGQRYDLVVFGATGFTGQFVVEEVARTAQQEKSHGKVPLSWAIAGRSKSKLQDVLTVAKKETGLSLEDVGLIQADVSDQKSLHEMAAKSNVVINCVGPYQLYGEPVVQACVENGANHVDISGEPVFMESMQLKYSKAAEQAGVHIVNACGYDSIPADMGIVHMMRNLKGDLNSVEMFVHTSGGGSRAAIHTGTMESAALAIANRSKVGAIRRELFPKPLPKPKYKAAKKRALYKNDKLGYWGVTFPSDAPVVYRTQRYRHDVLGERPIQFQQFIRMPSVVHGAMLILGMVYFALLSSFTWTRNLLFKYPDILTAGVFKRAGAKREELKNLKFTVTQVGHGWSEKLAEGSDQYTSPPDSSIIVKVKGPDPGYGATSIMMVSSAMTILREKNLCAEKGGVMTPGMAFSKTDLIDRLCDRGMSFTVEQQQ